MRYKYVIDLVSRGLGRTLSTSAGSHTPQSTFGSSSSQLKSPLAGQSVVDISRTSASSNVVHQPQTVIHYHYYTLSPYHPAYGSRQPSPWMYAAFGVGCASVGYLSSGWLHSDNATNLTHLSLPGSKAFPDWVHLKSWLLGTAEASAAEDASDGAYSRNIMPLPAPAQQQPVTSNLPMSRTSISEAAARAAPAVVHLVVSNDKASSHHLVSHNQSGSGFIYDESGYILTNAHLVSGKQASSSLYVTLQDGRLFPGHVLAIDRATDLAVVKIDSDTPLPAVRLGSSAHLRAGEWVVALGSPLLLKHSVTAGIISCVQRKGAELGLYDACTEYIQTDAAVNQGNSGGPLVNLDGEVVAISSMKAVAADGVSFAVPIDTAKAVVDSLHRLGRVPRPYLGITMCEVTEENGKLLRQRMASFPDVLNGIAIPMVTPGSPADKAGLKNGDVIVGWEGLQGQAPTAKRLVESLQQSIGRRISLHVVRPADVQVGAKQEELRIAVVPTEAPR